MYRHRERGDEMIRTLSWSAVLALTISLVVSARAQVPGGRGAQGRDAVGRGRGAIALPEGPGKAQVEAYCQGCHQLGNIAFSGGYTREGWEQLIGTMIALPKEQKDVVLDYLAKNFPEQPKPKPVLLNGDAKATFKEWNLPTLGSRPHDPLAAADGSIWYTGMFANTLGRIDPRTGQIKEYPLKTPQSGPHGLTEDKSGKIWFSANQKGYIGKLDPATGEITEYKLPQGTRDPHTPLFDRNGILWFSAQGANMAGRLDPSTGDVKVVTYPQPRSNPYGVVIDSKGAPIICEFGGNRISRLDPASMEIHEWTLPNPDSRPRRIAITSDDVVWYSDYSRGHLGRLDTKTGDVKEWPSPGGPRSQPYGITSIKDVIWYSESAVRPNTLVRFDPKTQKFQTWIIPGGGGVVRNMMPTRDGNIVIAESGVNKVGLVTVQ
jgi:virginiamycin B lyase